MPDANPDDRQHGLAPTPASKEAPEAGTSPAAPGLIRGVDAAGLVVVNSPCRRCGYDLVGLSASGVCPECGAPIARSLHGNLLAFAEPAYLHRLRTGALLAQAHVVAIVLVAFASCLLGSESAAWLAWTGIAFLALAAWWLLSTPDPAHVGRDEAGRSRRVLRCALVVGAACKAVSAGLAAMGAGILPGVGPATIGLPTGALEYWVLLPTGAAWAVGWFASFAYLGSLARRIPDARLAKRARDVMFAPIVAVGVIGGTVVLSVLFPPFALAGIGAIGLGVVITYAMLFVLLDGLRAALSAIVERHRSGA